MSETFKNMGLFFQKYYFGGINFDKEEKRPLQDNKHMNSLQLKGFIRFSWPIQGKS